MPAILGTTPGVATGASAIAPASSGPVALLVPLTGPLAPVGQVLENAAKLAFPGASSLDVRDTGGTPQGAAAAAQAAVSAGDGLILGPLTSAEAHAVGPVAQTAHIGVLAFTNDDSVAAPGVWALGITPHQQVARVVQVAADGGHNQFAALLPDTEFGHSLDAALRQQAAALGGAEPRVNFYEHSFSSLNQAVEAVSDFGDRGEGLMARIKAAKALDTAAGSAQARALQRQPIPPPPFNAFLIGATTPEELAEIATLLPYYAVSPPAVQLLGPTLWAQTATAMGRYGVYRGALYAAPDPAAAASFQSKYQAAYGSAPPAIGDVAFDAASIAALLADQGGYRVATLTNPAGFSGADGVLQLEPDGQVRRALAVFEIESGGPVIASPAPSALGAPAS
jgi:ABC-type branched-subunit amino acid transport system substrate-binding protein